MSKSLSFLLKKKQVYFLYLRMHLIIIVYIVSMQGFLYVYVHV